MTKAPNQLESDLVFAPEDLQGSDAKIEEERWTILVVDDDRSVHTATQFALEGFSFRNQKLQFLNAYGTAEAENLLIKHPEIALVFLDVIMETHDAGLNLVKFIRNELGNQVMQIIMRTGQPGDMPEEKLIQDYAINDYKLKPELTRDRLFTCVTLGLRSYGDLSVRNRIASEMIQTNNKLKELNENLESIVKERTGDILKKQAMLENLLSDNKSLLRVMAHDIRNYLTIILGSTRIGMRKPGEEAGKYFEKIERAANSQLSLIENISNLEAVSSGKKSMELKSVAISEILSHASFTFETQLKAKNLNLDIVNQNSEDLKIVVDPVLFANCVINNIVSNTIKFSQPGDHINITVHEPEDGFLRLSVRDHGLGIPPDILENLFSFDKKTTRVGTGGEKGTGFGMPIVKSFIEKMDGRIQVMSKTREEDEKDFGTEFILWVPLFRAQNQSAA